MSNYRTFKAKFPSKCAATGMKINTGDLIAWYPETKNTYKLCTLFPSMKISEVISPSHFIFKYVEGMFNEWFDNSDNYHREPYTGWGEDEPAVFDKKGAIIGAIENMFEEMEETGKPIHLHAFDIEAAFV